MSSIQVFEPTVACKIVQCGDEVFLFGVPPEVTKSIRQLEMPMPTAIVLPDKVFLGWHLQNCTEFPFYYFLFFLSKYPYEKKIKFLGSAKALDNNEQLLRICVLGPTREEYRAIGLDDVLVNMFLSESQYFALKDPQGEVMPISKMIENYCFNAQGVAELPQGVQVLRVDFNKYKVLYRREEVLVDLNSSEFQSPPYSLRFSHSTNRMAKFSIQIIGGASGFSLNNPSSGMLITYNGNYILVDAIPFLNEQLLALGIARDQIHSIFLTHIHDDHCNLFSFVQSARKVNILSTREIFWMAMFKLALMMHCTVEEVASYFNWIPLFVGQTLDYYGLRLTPHYSIHTIPTIGGVVEVLGASSNVYSVAITADNQSLDDAQQMFEKKIISKKRLDDIVEIYRRPFDCLFADGGQGLIHGNPRDAMLSLAKRIVFFHLDKLPGEFDTSFSLASSGKSYVIVQGSTDFYITRAVEFFLKKFAFAAPEWISILMGHAEIVRYNTDDVVIKQGDESNHKIFIIVTGYCDIIYYDGRFKKLLASKQAGDFFGEMAIFSSDKQRNASVVARTPVTLCEISENIFYSLIVKEQMYDRLALYWKMRDSMGQLPFFSQLPHSVIDDLSKHARLVSLVPESVFGGKKGEALCFFILVQGGVCFREGGKSWFLKPGEVFCNFFDGGEGVEVLKDALCFSIPREYFLEILDQSPVFRFALKEGELRMYPAVEV